MKKASSTRLWIGVAFGFALLAAAYYAAFKTAGAAQIRDVPLATPGAGR